jgi:hypothetical protein
MLIQDLKQFSHCRPAGEIVATMGELQDAVRSHDMEPS